MKRTVIDSDIPDAIDPFLFVFIEKTEFYGGIKVTLWGIGARLMTLTVAVYDLSS